ncbi:GAF domain-containing protein [Pengzhenrongella phosphoraccumulans]|uniref:GAF domain-containing protein n=1 Tax=Pengzhenrongella phosphoraccumulans TaxID=3114394 RepID=UPI00388CF581
MAHDDRRFSAPTEYSRWLRRAHELTISGQPQQAIAPGLIDSWQRSLAAGVNPDAHSPRHVHEVAETVALRRDHRLGAVIPALTALLADETTSGEHLLVVAGATGEVLWRAGSRAVLREAERLEFVEGADWSESGVGTNAISEVVVNGRPAQLFSGEHLVRTHHAWACTAAPIRDPRSGRVLGVLDISGPLHTLTPDSLRLITCGVRLAEELLRTHDGARTGPGRRTDREHANHADQGSRPLSLRLLGEEPVAVLPDGGRIGLTLRRAEILALLDSRDGGWSADELAYELHGETGNPATIRVEMHRIRAAIGDVLSAQPYRLVDEVRGTSDAARVHRLLRAGRLRDAFSLYSAPLLARSATLAIALLREELNSAVGAAVRTSGQADLIRRWCATDMGAADGAAVLALGHLVGPRDPGFLAARSRAGRIGRALS